MTVFQIVRIDQLLRVQLLENMITTQILMIFQRIINTMNTQSQISFTLSFETPNVKRKLMMQLKRKVQVLGIDTI